jgi:Metallo-peptidase family M12B Reprolysin-like/Cadherin-like/Secretion system C-terminal sorting domain
MKSFYLLPALFFTLNYATAQPFFDPVETSTTFLTTSSTDMPTTFKAYRVNTAGLSSIVATAPDESELSSNAAATMIDIPLPDGTMEPFRIWNIHTLEAALYKKYPEIRTFSGCSVRQPGMTLRGTITVRGLSLMLLLPDMGAAYVEPIDPTQPDLCMAYDRKAIPIESVRAARAGLRPPLTAKVELPATISTATPATPRGPLLTPVRLRTLRLAVACTGEFAQDHGGTRQGALAAIVDYSNRLSAIYERDMAIRFILVAENEVLINLDGATDPYPGPDPSSNAGPNALIVNSRLGEEKYDVGHVLMRGGGGVSLGLGIACGRNKAGGATAGSGRYGDNFIGVFCQEVGHQLAANHTWNRCGGFSGDQRAGKTAFEPGSGSTIMSYVGGCGTDNIQSNTDLYFHIGSIEEIQGFFAAVPGCGTVSATTNNAPQVTLPYRDGFQIPILTPFELKGSATDPDGHTLTYCWEQVNYGPEAALGQQIGNSALFRTLPPVAASNRYFPRYTTVLNNASDRTEILPAVSRDMNFRLTARDNFPIAGGVHSAEVAFRANANAGPFLVVSPNTADVSWPSGGIVAVRWAVANTNVAPVNCKKVNILLSTDGGQTWPIVLASETENDGQQEIDVPDVETTRARLRIDAADNIFYDLSNANFTIAKPTKPVLTAGIGSNGGRICLPEPFSTSIRTIGLGGFNTPVQLTLLGNLPAGSKAEFSPARIQPGEQSTLILTFGTIPRNDSLRLTVRLAAGTDTFNFPLRFELVRNDFSDFRLLSPADGASGVSQLPTLRWRRSGSAAFYDFQLASSPDFSDQQVISTLTNTTLDSFRVNKLLGKSGGFYWRVRPSNACTVQDWSPTAFFSTFVENCTTTTATDLPRNITTNGTPTIESVLDINADIKISDLNIKQIRGTHEAFSQLTVSLVGPDSTIIRLFNNRCPNRLLSFNFGLDDAAPTAFICPVSAVLESSYRPDIPLSTFNNYSSKGKWRLRVFDNTIGVGGRIDGFQLEFCGAKTVVPLVLVNNNPLRLPRGEQRNIVPDLLLVRDGVVQPSNLVYTIVDSPRFGQLFTIGSGNKPLQAGDIFSQQDIDQNTLSYRYIGDAAQEDGFRFTVANGQGAFLGTLRFVINPSEVSTKEPDAAPVQLDVYPNPTPGQVWFQLSATPASAAQLRLFDLSGRLVRETVWPSGSTVLQWALDEVTSGIYIAQYRDQRGLTTRKIMIDRR